MAKLKFHPRDSLPNRTALARADALFGELTGEPRQVLAAALGDLRAALEGEKPLHGRTRPPGILPSSAASLSSRLSSSTCARPVTP